MSYIRKRCLLDEKFRIRTCFCLLHLQQIRFLREAYLSITLRLSTKESQQRAQIQKALQNTKKQINNIDQIHAKKTTLT